MGGRVSKRVPKKSRHIEWNWEQSSDDPEKVRYHFVIVDDKNRKEKINRIIQNLCEWGGAIEPIRRDIEGPVIGSGFRYLFESYDINQKPCMINFTLLGKPVMRNKGLYERVKKRHSIEQYVENRFEKSS